MTRASLSPDRLVAPAPMLATLGPAPRGGQFAVEVKFDGQRGILTVDRRVRVTSRNGADITETFPELSAVAAAVGGRRMVLDGEIVAVDEHGRPSFRRLQRRWPQQRRPGAQLVREVPTRFLAFDVMNIEGEDITHWPYRERRELLDTLMVMESSPALTVPSTTVVDRVRRVCAGRSGQRAIIVGCEDKEKRGADRRVQHRSRGLA